VQGRIARVGVVVGRVQQGGTRTPCAFSNMASRHDRPSRTECATHLPASMPSIFQGPEKAARNFPGLGKISARFSKPWEIGLEPFQSLERGGLPRFLHRLLASGGKVCSMTLAAAPNGARWRR
jgi:hypothetical protein